MEMKLLSGCIVFLTMVFLFSIAMQKTKAQAPQSSCTQLLQPCMGYLNGNREPPRSCCDPLKYVINQVPECLCSMMSVNGTKQAQKAGINLADAQQLPARCGQRINPLGCILGAPGSTSASFPLRIPSTIMAAASWVLCFYYGIV